MAAGARPTLEEILKDLKNDAAGDAAHDFDGTRGGFIFKTFFNSGRHDIGTPENPGELLEEWQLINKFLQIVPNGADGKPPTDKACGDEFKAIYLNEGARPPITRVNGDPVRYNVQSRFVATKRRGTDDERDWRIRSADLYRFLNGGSENRDDFTFTIDAASVPISEGLTNDKGASTHTATYVLTREGITDGALKTNKGMETVAGNIVKIEKKYDDDPSTVAYPATDITRINTLHPTELFYSKYPIHIPPVVNISGVRATSIKFTNRMMTGEKDKFKSLAEDKNPNTVSNLSKLLVFFTAIMARRGAGSGIAERDYHMCLQFKRAGDWLQVLACLFPERFKLPKTRRIRLVTMDRICFLFALKMGIDVVFTMTRENAGQTEYWLLTFYKESVDISPKVRILGELPTLVNPNDPIPIFISRPGEAQPKPGENYKACKKQYIESYDAVEGELLNHAVPASGNLDGVGGFNTKLAAIAALVPSSSSDKDLERHLLRVFKVAMRLASFRSLCIKIEERNEEGIYKKLLDLRREEGGGGGGGGGELTKKDIQVYDVFIPLYRYQYQAVTKAAASKSGPGARTATGEIANYFSSLFDYASLTKTLKAKFDIIDKLNFTGRTHIFFPNNLNENGTGIFTYLNNGLTVEEKGKIIEIMALIGSKVSATNINTYTKLFKMASLLQGRPPALTIAEVSAEEILRSMFFPIEEGTAEVGDTGAPSHVLSRATAEVQRMPVAGSKRRIEDEAGGAGGAGGAPAPQGISEDSSIIEVSDFFAGQVILADRAQNHYHEEPIRTNYNAGAAAARAALPAAARNAVNNALALNQGGGSRSSTYNHNPLTTFCFLLWELNCNLPAEGADLDMLYRLSRIVEYMLTENVKKVLKMNIKDVYKYLYSLETFLLEGLAEKLPNRNINHFMAGIKEDYYGFNTVTNYKKFIHLSSEEIHTYISLKPRNISIKELVKQNTELLKMSIFLAGTIEGLILTKGSISKVRRSTSRVASSRRSTSKMPSTRRSTSRVATGRRSTSKRRSTSRVASGRKSSSKMASTRRSTSRVASGRRSTSRLSSGRSRRVSPRGSSSYRFRPQLSVVAE
jgi:hypothetical protein